VRACPSADVTTNVTDFHSCPVNVTTRRMGGGGGKKRNMDGDDAYTYLLSPFTPIPMPVDVRPKA
jgi:hypothetical protein